MKQIFTIISLLLFSFIIKSENPFKYWEDSIIKIEKIISESNDNDIKKQATDKLLETLKFVLIQPNSYKYSFSKLKFAVLQPKDKSFKIFNWNLPYNNGTHKYYGIIQLPPKKKISKIIILEDKSDEIKNPFQKICTANNWFGALYFKIIPIKSTGKKYYTLLAWDGEDNSSNKKIIEILSFNKDNSVEFGAPLFISNQLTTSRVIFEYAEELSMLLSYEKQNTKTGRAKRKVIVFDHLAPKSESLKGQFQYYGPDLSYDAFIFKKGKWNYIRDIDAKSNEKSKTNDSKKPNLGLFK